MGISLANWAYRSILKTLLALICISGQGFTLLLGSWSRKLQTRVADVNVPTSEEILMIWATEVCYRILKAVDRH